jgi:hypothetical protein
MHFVALLQCKAQFFVQINQIGLAVKLIAKNPVRISVGTDLSPSRQMLTPGVKKPRATGRMRPAILFYVARGNICKLYIGLYTMQITKFIHFTQFYMCDPRTSPQYWLRPFTRKVGHPWSIQDIGPTVPSKSFTCHPRIDVVLSEMLTAQWHKPRKITCSLLINWK